MKSKGDQQPGKDAPKWMRSLPREARGPGVSVPGSVQSTQVQGSEFKMRAVSAVVAESAESLV